MGEVFYLNESSGTSAREHPLTDIAWYGGDVPFKIPFKSNSLRINSGQFDLQDSSFVDQTL